ncbi:hypothetical protein TSUD_410270 [Trifolium subterraneum]|uniref:Uncharacterized protein n=1 Tax=Trifolium subterraneum TaxID=3900 RepID=A0A2Z6P7B5_TRISU|nr:hypothetical protein TSUD_410270 [Trifolium subterraneum]
MSPMFTPAKPAAKAIRRVIELAFPDNITCYGDIIEDDNKDIWFQRFGFHGHLITRKKLKPYFNQRCGKRLSDILTKARKKKEKPDWIHKEGWTYLTNKWKEEEFKKRSERNTINRASSKGGALHTTCRKAHHDIALDMSSKLGRPVDPDELFVVTHKKKNGNWVIVVQKSLTEACVLAMALCLYSIKSDFDEFTMKSVILYNEYHQKLAQMTQTNGGATGDTQKIDGSQKMQIWKDAAGGKSRGRCYGTGQLAANLRNGVTHLTYEAEAPHTRAENQIIEAARAEAAAARADANAARADAEAAKADAAAAKATTRSFEINLLQHHLQSQAVEYHDEEMPLGLLLVVLMVVLSHVKVVLAVLSTVEVGVCDVVTCGGACGKLDERRCFLLAFSRSPGSTNLE